MMITTLVTQNVISSLNSVSERNIQAPEYLAGSEPTAPMTQWDLTSGTVDQDHQYMSHRS